ncbi:hypothetical protein [Streptomyces sp. NBC_01511]
MSSVVVRVMPPGRVAVFSRPTASRPKLTACWPEVTEVRMLEVS